MKLFDEFGISDSMHESRDLPALWCSLNVNAAGTIVPTVGQNSPNSTNTFSAAGHSNAASPTYGKSSFIDASQLPDDPDIPELEDITYSDNEDDVGAEADFNNLETSITVSPIPTTRVHKDHPVSQIIGDLSLTTETRSMIRVVQDQGGLSQMFNDDFHTCMFACFLSHEFQLISSHKIFRGLPIALLNVVELYGIFDAFLLLKIIFQEYFLQIVIAVY
nr:hypothetical protein [Tanacetum cinerariifolium]